MILNFTSYFAKEKVSEMFKKPAYYNIIMPKYRVDINKIVSKEMAEAMIHKACCPRDRFLVALLYITGARPDEISGIKKEAIRLVGENVEIKIKTLKLGKKKEFLIRERILTFRPNTPFLDVILNHWKFSPTEDLIHLGVRRIEQIIGDVSSNEICPYNFRHSRLTKLARSGATIDQLMYWKGAKDTRSVGAYLRAKKVVFDVIE